MSLDFEIERLRSRCVGCGRCVKVCPSFRHGGLNPMEVMQGGEGNLDTCIGCGCCSEACAHTNPAIVMKDLIARARGIHVSQVFRDTGYAMPPADDAPEPGWTGDGVGIMPGCVVKAKVPYVNLATASALRAMGFGCRELPGNTCCMHPVQFREMTEDERVHYKRVMGDSAGGDVIVTLCGGCSDELIDADVPAEHIVQFLHRNLDRLPRFDSPVRVGLEPGCSVMKHADLMREVVEAMGCEIVNTTMGCCGKNTPVSNPLMDEREQECKEADWIVVACPMCLVKFDAQPEGIPTVHVSELVAMAAGDRDSLGYHRNRRQSEARPLR